MFMKYLFNYTIERCTCINIRDILSSTNIDALKSSTIGKTIPSLNENANIGNAARIMNLHRLRSLPVIDRDNQKVIIGQISSKRIIKHIYDTLLRKKINFQKMISASDIMTQEHNNYRSYRQV